MNQETLDCIKGQRVCRRLSYGDLKPLHVGIEATDMDFLTPELLSGYCSSGSVEVSNHRVFLELYGKLPNVYAVYGGYGTFAVAIRLDSITPEMIEALNSLKDYPVLDEDDYSEVEMEAENDAWESWGRSDFRTELDKRFPDLNEIIFEWGAETIDTLYCKLMERTNTYWEHETGNNAFVRMERVIEGATEQDITEAI